MAVQNFREVAGSSELAIVAAPTQHPMALAAKGPRIKKNVRGEEGEASVGGGLVGCDEEDGETEEQTIASSPMAVGGGVLCEFDGRAGSRRQVTKSDPPLL
ncbi:hypothetical protein L2E82_31013 [Cichorium intybus]|uniref:Uncharacterized protein n=1 Tax=Cichorium intybus TaxID=13427 RepID=A0ACB9D226_CICIN|nr:hypothetical protein L2E82_31013 [Cichorium intybus]